MSDAHPTPDHEAPHEGPIRTPKQLIIAVIFAFLVPIVAIILLVSYVQSQVKPGAGSEGLGEEAIARRIQPVGEVEIRDVSDPAALKTGEQVFTAQCSACHATGAAGAPKLGDESGWAARIKTGYEALLNSALKGKGAMPPQGGGDATDLEIGRAVVYMANKSGAKFDEPKAAPAATASTGAAPAAAPATDVAATQAAIASAVAGTQAKPAGGAGAAPALYSQTCATCHGAGVAGAPKLGDKAAWGPRLAKGLDGLTADAIKGIGAMPPKGGAMNASDAEIKAVVSYMVDQAK